MLLLVILLTLNERVVSNSVSTSLGHLPSLNDEKDLALYVNSFNPTKNGGCRCDLITLLCQCSVRMNSNCDTSTSYTVDAFTAALVVDSLNKEHLLKQKDDECTSELPKEEKVWPPKTPFRYENRYLGLLTGEEEPVLHLKMFPLQPRKINTQFFLYQATKGATEDSSDCEKSQFKSTRIHYENATSIKDSVDRCDSLYFIIHGFRQTHEDDILVTLRRNLLNYTRVTRPQWTNCVVGVDWRTGAQLKPLKGILSEAAVNTITVGREVALISYTLVISDKVAAQDIHLIGFSLGAQVAHFAAVWFKRLPELVNDQLNTKTETCESDWIEDLTKSTSDKGRSNWLLGRVTGLDPAAREFSTYQGSHLLASDANFVDIIHTSACEYSGSYIDVLNARFGMSEAVGTVDFYPNGGSSPQPECSLDRSNVGCSHNRAVIFFSDSLDQSIEAASFLSTSCDVQYQNDSSNGQENTQKHQHISCMGIRAMDYPGRGRQFLKYKSKGYQKDSSRKSSQNTVY